MEWHVKRRGWCLRLKNWSSLIVVGLLVAMAGCASESSSAPTTAGPPSGPPKVQLGSVICLTTQWYPQVAQNEDETENRPVRELVRQAVLMAARDELGLVTRDETLGEPFPKSDESAEQNAAGQADASPKNADESGRSAQSRTTKSANRIPRSDARLLRPPSARPHRLHQPTKTRRPPADLR